MDSQISYKLFSNQDNKVSNNIFFLHGNGFPPDSYSNFLNILSSKANIYAMNQKPFHPTNINPNLIYGWDIFKNEDTVETENIPSKENYFKKIILPSEKEIKNHKDYLSKYLE